MDEYTLTRKEFRNDCTKGELRYHGSLLCYTLEPPWLQNESFKSCILNGLYQVRRWQSQKFGACFRLYGVPDRDSILIHKGNFPKDTEGCILVGAAYTPSEPAVYGSTVAMDRLHAKLPTEFNLRIRSFLTDII